MSDYTLSSLSALSGYDKDHGGVHLTELTGLAIVSIALPLDGEIAAEKAIKTAFGIALPAIGQSAVSKDGAVRLARLGRDQLFVIFLTAPPDAEQMVAAKLKGTAYTTDQTDVWIGLKISGPNARTALARICPLDLHPDVFAIDNAARTVMEHLGALILRVGPDSFMLLSASSSAQSFLHALEVSIRNVN